MGDADSRAPSLLDAPPVIENPTDAELVEAARGGDSFAITRLWQRHLAVAWCAARAASGRADAEPVVVRTAERLIADLGEGRGPVGATRPHLLALTRRAVADLEAAEPPAGPAAQRDGVAEAPALELAPIETYRDLMPDGIGGDAVATAFTSLPTRWQEALWLAEVEGHSAAEIAAELGMTAEAVETTLADARAALRAEWSSRRLAGLPDDAPCRAAAASPKDDRRIRTHLGDCPGCRAVAATPEAASRRALATLPLLLLGAGGGIAFLESLRAGASAAATEPVPTVAGAAALVAEAEALRTSTTEVAGASPTERVSTLRAALVGAVRTAPPRRLAAVGGALAGIAATTALVVSLVAGGSAGGTSRFLADSDAASDIAEPAPHLVPPVVVATDVPDDPESARPPTAAPDATQAPAPAPGTGTDGSGDAPTGEAPSGEAPSGEAPPGEAPSGEAPTGDGAPRPGGGTSGAGGGGQPIAAPRPPADPQDRAPLHAELGRPGTNGWRPLTVTGEPGADFTVSNGGDILFTGALDAAGTTVLQVRGAGGDVEQLVLSYGSAGGTSYTAAAAPSEETARGRRIAEPTPAP